MEVPAMHTLEHLGATYLRNSSIGDKIVYFGPMGCRTGFYLLVANEWKSEQILPYILEFLDFTISFTGDIPGALAKECGNYLEQDLVKAKEYAKKYKEDLLTYKRLQY
jgi:S-ribosylhomocysteine lyase